MKIKVFFIMIFALLATTFVVAQEGIVVYEGASSNYDVNFQPGNNYQWEVLSQFNPTIYATSDDYAFVTGEDTNEVQILWKRQGRFYVILNEFDESGCTNAKALAVLVLGNNRSIGFESVAAKSCFKSGGNSFDIPVKTLNGSGLPLESQYFPLNVEFDVNGNVYSQQIGYNNQVISVSDEWFDINSELDTEIDVEITKVTDDLGVSLEIRDADKTYIYTIYAIPEISLIQNQTDTVYLNASYSIEAEFNEDYTYEWWYTDSGGERYDFNSNTNITEAYIWDTVGTFEIFVQATDNNGCLSEIISKNIIVMELESEIVISAGNDTIIGSCNTYQINALVSNPEGLSYLWSSVENLDDPTVLNPVFTPGISTKFYLTVTNSNGFYAKDSVLITVVDVVANAGEDVFMYANSSVILDGSYSTGLGLKYNWTTENGFIESGENTANPVVTQIGTYFLHVTDTFGCSSHDSLNVGILTYAPVAQDDYDTTSYRTEVIIPVLNNDSDQDNDIDSLSLIISSAPYNGTAYVNYDDFTIHYTPDDDFSGTDYFEYRICDLTENCDEAKVTVWVSDIQFFIPDAFSPNGDNINDYFEIPGIEYYEGNSIEIFNRWGNKVYTARNYGISAVPKYWNGKSNTGFRLGSEDLPTGTYFYILNLGKGEERIAGSVYLDR